jgi:hypothetical protein
METETHETPLREGSGGEYEATTFQWTVPSALGAAATAPPKQIMAKAPNMPTIKLLRRPTKELFTPVDECCLWDSGRWPQNGPRIAKPEVITRSDCPHR